MDEHSNFFDFKFYYYYTFWNVLLVLFYPITSKYFDVVFSTLSVLLISSYFMYINSKSYYATVIDKYNVDKIYIQLMHLFVHIIPFFLILYWETSYHINYIKLLTTMSVMYIYCLVIDVEQLYKISREEIVLIFILAFILLHLR